MKSVAKIDRRGVEQRLEIIRMVAQSKRGHIASAFSVMEILRVLYDDVLRVNPHDPTWKDRDRFIFSKGHGCLALYVILAEKGFFPREELQRFCSFKAMLGGHPEMKKIPGVEASTGALGHGLSIGVGCALAARLDQREYRTFILVGDGECNEGTVWEAALSASKHSLRSLTVLVDYNEMQSYGSTHEIQELEPFADKWGSFGFAVREVDGHDIDALRHTLLAVPFSPDRPNAVICHTIKGKGIPSMESVAEWHHKSKLGDGEVAALRAELERNP